MRLALPSTLVAAAFAAAAIASPATAQPNLDRAGTTGQTHSAPAVQNVRPDPDAQMPKRSLFGPPVLPSAAASQQPQVHRTQAAASRAFAYQPPASARYSTAGLNGYVRSHITGASIVHGSPHENPFDWGAAAIGAAGGLLISLLVIGGGIALAHRRQPELRRTKALA